MSEIREGDRVRFVAGRGYAVGRVVCVIEGIVSISTRAGKIIRRVAAACEKVTAEPPPVADGAPFDEEAR